MEGRAPLPCQRGFTVVELLTVLGLVALLAALFLPVVARVRATAASAGCLANLKQIGTAWTVAMADDQGRLLVDDPYTSGSPDLAWDAYWVGVIGGRKVGAGTLLCPAAPDASPGASARGYGSAAHAWTGRYGPPGTGIYLNPQTFRESSYGFNRWVAEGRGFGAGGGAATLSEVADAANVPVFFDCAYADARPEGGTAATPVKPPPDLTGSHAGPGRPEHWKFVMARHGRGINVYRADGSAAWVRPEELYLLTWKSAWSPYRLSLPRE